MNQVKLIGESVLTRIAIALMVSLAGMACISAPGCDRDDFVSDLRYKDTSSSSTDAQNVDAPSVQISDLLGTWRGASYQHDTGTFHVDPPFTVDTDRRKTSEVEPDVIIQMLIEVEEKYLQLTGVESCHVTLTYKSRSGEEFKERKMFRIFPPEDPQRVTTRSGPLGVRKTETLRIKDHITFESGIMKFDVVSWQDESMELLGRSVSIESKTVLRPVRLKLSRDQSKKDKKGESAILD